MLTLLISSAGATLALLLALPAHVPSALAWRLPLLLAAAALGGRLHIDGPLAGHISALGPHGLLGPPQSADSLTRHLTVTAMPLALSVLTVAAVVVAARGGDRRAAGRRADTVRLVGVLAGGFAVIGLLLAVVGRVELVDGTVRAGLVATPVGAAVVAALAAAAVALADFPRIAAALRAAGCCGIALLAVGLPVLVLVALVSDLGVVSALLYGGRLPAGLALTLALLLAPTVIWDAAALGLGVPVRLSGRLDGFGLHRSVTVLDAAGSVPLAAFLPIGAAAILLIAAVVVHRRWPGPGVLAGYVGGLGCLGVLMYVAGRLGLHSTPAGGDRASLLPAAAWALVLPFVWGAALGLLAPRVAGLFEARPVVRTAVDRVRS